MKVSSRPMVWCTSSHIWSTITMSYKKNSLSMKIPVHVSSVPYKHKKVQNFFWHFRTEILRILAFFLPPKTGIFVSHRKPYTAAVHGTSLWYDALSTEKTCRTQTKDFFFLEINVKSEKKMPPSTTMTFFFLEITLKPDRKDEKFFGIFTLILLRTFTLFPAFSQEVKT